MARELDRSRLLAEHSGAPLLTRARLREGVEAYLYPDRALPLVNIRQVFGAGSTQDPDHLHGLARLTLQGMRNGSKSCPPLEFVQQMEARGIDLMAWSSWESSALSVEALSQDSSFCMKFLGELFREPLLEERRIEFLCSQQRETLLSSCYRGEALLEMALSRLIFGYRDFGRSTLGDLPSLERIRLADVVEFYEGELRPSPRTLIVVGDFEEDRILEDWDRWTGPQEEGQGRKASFSGLGPRASVEDLTHGDNDLQAVAFEVPKATKGNLGLGCLAPSRKNPDYLAVRVALFLLTSRLNQVLGESLGKVYRIQMKQNAYSHAGSVVLHTVVEPEDLGETLQIFRNVLSRLGGGEISADEVLTAARYLEGLAMRSLQSYGGISSLLSSINILGLTPDSLSQELASVKRLEVESIVRVFDTWASLRSWKGAWVGPAGPVAEELEVLGRWQVSSPGNLINGA